MTGSRLPKISPADRRLIAAVREIDSLLAKPMFVLRMAHARMSGDESNQGATTQVIKACREIDVILRSYRKRRQDHVDGYGHRT